MSRAIVILGQGRSGTSITAGILHSLGVFVGDAPSRYYEDGAFYNVHKAMVGDWRNPQLDALPQHLDRYRALVAKRQEYDLWGLKDPRLCFTFPVLLPLLDDTDVRIIYTSRPIKDIARSLGTYPGVESRAEAKRIAERYKVALAQTKMIVPKAWPTMTLYYNALIRDPRKQVGRLARFVGVSVVEEAIALVKTSE